MPPIVARHDGAAAYLVAWGRRRDGWWALLTWIETLHRRDGTRESARRVAWVPAGEVVPIDGQDYSGVPRIRPG